MPTASFLREYYSWYYRTEELRTTTSDARRFAKHVTAPMRALNASEPFRILDFGGGDGSLAVSISEHLRATRDHVKNFAIDLVDYESPRQFENEHILLRGNETLAAVEGGYDLILASAILEHIPQVNETIRRLIELASNGAYFYARTPYVVPFTKIFPNLDLTYPAHVHDMGASFWNRFGNTFNLSAELIVSRPSIVETKFTEAPIRTLAAFAMKLPSHFELAIRQSPADPFWKLVGGWEAIFHFD